MRRLGRWHIPEAKVARSWLYPAIIFLVGLLPLTWLRGSVIAGMDYPYPLTDPGTLLAETLSTWGNGVGLGNQLPLGIKQMDKKMVVTGWFIYSQPIGDYRE